MLSSSRDALLKLSKTISPEKLFLSDCANDETDYSRMLFTDLNLQKVIEVSRGLLCILVGRGEYQGGAQLCSF